MARPDPRPRRLPLLQCSFVEHAGGRVVYRRYASLFFLVGVDGDEVRAARNPTLARPRRARPHPGPDPAPTPRRTSSRFWSSSTPSSKPWTATLATCASWTSCTTSRRRTMPWTRWWPTGRWWTGAAPTCSPPSSCSTPRRPGVGGVALARSRRRAARRARPARARRARPPRPRRRRQQPRNRRPRPVRPPEQAGRSARLLEGGHADAQGGGRLLGRGVWAWVGAGIESGRDRARAPPSVSRAAAAVRRRRRVLIVTRHRAARPPPPLACIVMSK